MSSRVSRSKHRSGEPEFWTLINELPDPVPVSKAELDAIERYFADVVEACLKPPRSPQTLRT